MEHWSAAELTDMMEFCLIFPPAVFSTGVASPCLTRAETVQRFSSQINMMFATQSLLYALGVGASKMLPASAAINWMMKEGLGKLARMSIATSFAQNFDSQVKVRWQLLVWTPTANRRERL